MTIDRLKELKRDLDDLAMSHSHTDEFDSYDFYDSMPQTFGDLERLIDDEIERQSVKDESINMAIELLEHYLRLEYYRGYAPKENYASYDLAIDALRAYKPKEPCEWCSRFSTMATQDTQRS